MTNKARQVRAYFKGLYYTKAARGDMETEGRFVGESSNDGGGWGQSDVGGGSGQPEWEIRNTETQSFGGGVRRPIVRRHILTLGPTPPWPGGANITKPDPLHLMGLHLMGLHLMDLHLMGVHLMGVHLMGVHLMDIYFMGLYFINMYFINIL